MRADHRTSENLEAEIKEAKAKSYPPHQKFDGTPREVPEFTVEREDPFREKYSVNLSQKHAPSKECFVLALGQGSPNGWRL
ncbi:hypothetical protein Tco_1174681 [Tanacetum coccineum]